MSVTVSEEGTAWFAKFRLDFSSVVDAHLWIFVIVQHTKLPFYFPAFANQSYLVVLTFLFTFIFPAINALFF